MGIKGGAIYTEGSLICTNSTFKGNQFFSFDPSYGGAIYSAGDLTVIDTNFISNCLSGISSEAYGGAIYGVTVNIYGSYFENNSISLPTVVYGGAVCADTVNVYNSSFINNLVKSVSWEESFSQGGAISADTVNVYNSKFINNTAKAFVGSAGPFFAIGGAIGADDVNIHDSEFISNNAVCEVDKDYVPTISNGGAIYSGGDLNLSDCSFISNKAKDGQAFWGSAAYANIDNCTFTDNNYTLYKSSPDFTLSLIPSDVVMVGQDIEIVLKFHSSVSGNVTIGNETVPLVNYTASALLTNLPLGDTFVPITYSGDDKFNPIETNVTVTVMDKSDIVSAPDVTKYYGGPERFVVSVTDYEENPIANASVKININGVDYYRKTGAAGQTSVALGIPAGNYTATVTYGDIMTEAKIVIKSTVSGNNITKTFRNATQYYAKFVDVNGNILKNTMVTFNINGVFYDRLTNDEGVAKLNINLNPGEYIITAINTNSGEMYSNVVTVLPNIAENHNLTKYYRNDSQYVVRLLDDGGKPVGAGVNVTFNINGVLYTRTTNATGHAKLNINLEPGTYIITAMYKDLMTSNTIMVLPILEAEDLKMTYLDGSKFNVTLLDGQGKAYSGQLVTFNVNGVFYNRTTDVNGVAHLNINLMAGEYIITSSYNGSNIANRITISS